MSNYVGRFGKSMSFVTQLLEELAKHNIDMDDIKFEVGSASVLQATYTANFLKRKYRKLTEDISLTIRIEGDRAVCVSKEHLITGDASTIETLARSIKSWCEHEVKQRSLNSSKVTLTSSTLAFLKRLLGIK